MALYDPKEFPNETKADFTLADVLAWARTKPAGEEYNFCDASNCAVAKFGRETGRDHLIGIVCLRADYPILEDVAQGPYGDREDWTLGAFADRLEQALGK